MNVTDFDAWRERYDTMTYKEMKDFYNLVEVDHPLQQAYNADAFGRFLDYVIEAVGPITVLEIGGWKGELACGMLGRQSIIKWYNYEICEAAVQKSICALPRYKPIIPDDFVWNIELPSANVLIASHFIEHIRWWELVLLIRRLPRSISFIGLQSPLGASGKDWAGYLGTHIIEARWQDICDFLFVKDFVDLQLLGDGDFKAFWQAA